MNDKFEDEKSINCPLCEVEINVDSIRMHKDGGKRIYWECENCDLSVMHRRTKK